MVKGGISLGIITYIDELIGTVFSIVSAHLFCNLWEGEGQSTEQKGDEQKSTYQGVSDNIIAN